MRVLVGCEFSGIVRDAFAAQGHDAWSCDLLSTEREGPHLKGNVRAFLHDGWDLGIFHPPCTYLTVTRNKYYAPEYEHRFPDQYKKREEAVAFFAALLEAPIEKIAVENPVGIISTRIRKPDQIIQPYEYGHEDMKKTCLWLKNLPLLKRTKLVDPNISYDKSGKSISSAHHNAALKLPAEERWKARSRTYTGIAEAMAAQWGSL